MFDVKHETIKNCEVLNVWQKLPTLYNEYTIELVERKKDTCFPEYHEIKIQSSKLYDELLELKQNKKDRCVLAHGMADIDIYRKGKGYIIENSPNEGLYLYYEINTKEFDSILNALMPR